MSSLIAGGAGRILVAGSTSDANGKEAALVARLDGNGALDPSFGTGGSAVVQTGEGSGANRPFSFADSLFLTPTGRVGFGDYRIRAGDRLDHSAFELLDNGTPDVDFGSGGLATKDGITPPAYINTADAQAGPDGSVYVSGLLEGTPMTGANRKLALTKFNPQGSVVTGFGVGGTYTGTFSLSSSDTGTYGGPMIVGSDNKLLMAGTTLWTDGRQAMFLARFSTLNGQPDPSFGTRPGNTVVQAADAGGTDSQGSDLATGPLGAIYVAGRAEDAQGNFAMTLARFTPSGEPDTTFGTNGVKRFQLATGTDTYRGSDVSDVLVQPDGKVLLVGSASNTLSEAEGIVLRVRTDGTLDPTFGSGGVVRLQLAHTGGTSQTTRLSGAAIVGGRLVVAGGTRDTATNGFVARILLDPLADAPPGVPAGPGATPAPGGGVGPKPIPAARPSKGNVPTFKPFTRLTVNGTSHVRITLSCSKTGPCAGRVLLVGATGKVVIAAARSRRAATYASATFTIPAGRSKTLVVKLKAAARSRLRRHERVKARFVLAPAGAKSQTRSVSLVRRTR
ncbi:hypothetical protein DSM104299_02186 [Baekduia alba]|uniref:hypothetical protein n=1 Tax=Baekduia alba TaxID=2997333 RepID=UPI00234246E5|nr:hypothetical protein [Baekduia alba]WCB93473.1 hypothetical protein DSM104299_02186 [Baekduia alba]